MRNQSMDIGGPLGNPTQVSILTGTLIGSDKQGGDSAASIVLQAQRRTSSIAYQLLKPLIDFSICCLFMPILLPLFAALAVAVRMSSPGPVFYREKRIGRFGQAFTIYKFRSMYTQEYLREVLGYEECELTQLRRRQTDKGTVDPRVTRIGQLLRKTSLDELPQLLNVIRGEMTLVGPRPVVEAELLSYGDSALLYEMAVPGVTGLWQVSGRSNTSFEQRVHMDMYYCMNWSLWEDLSIVLRTVPVVLRGDGAY